MEKLLIVDGHNYLYRAYYGVPAAAKLKNGLQINAFYGFLSYLRKNISHIQPDKVIVVFDSETGIQSKLDQNKEYKQNRDYTDAGMFEQLPIIKNALEYLGITYIEEPDNEGDDVIASIANKKVKDGESFISSQDKDFFQVIKDNIYVLRDEKVKDDINYNYRKVIYTEDKFIKKWNFPPKYFLDYISLKGDPSDNIKGVDGIGKIRASRLIREYGDIEEVIANSKDKRISGKENLIRNNKNFLKMKTDIDINCNLKEINQSKVFSPSNEILKVLNYMN
jgi:DNA polymerase-1